jgi:multicomponent Na+:H+ antiporter subunit D
VNQMILPLSIILPLIGSLICFVSKRPVALVAGLLSAIATTVTVLHLAAGLLAHGVQIYAIGDWPAPLGIQFRADGLSGFFMVMTALSGLAISFYARHYFAGDNQPHGVRLFWPLWLFLWGAMNALFLSNDLFNIYVVLEIIGISAVGLVTLTGHRQVLIAGMRYLLAAMVGSLVYLLGVAFLYAAYSVLDISLLGEVIQPDRVAMAALGLMIAGLILKTALFPLHFWLPPAHASATAPVSAILSALVVKASFYLIVRLWFHVFPAAVTPSAGTLLGILGAAAILWGSVQALRQSRVKMMIAYSTVAQLGYLFFLFPISTAGHAAATLDAGSGALFQALAHAVAKSSLFLSAGILLHAAGNDQLHSMRGLVQRLPLTVWAIALAGISLMGLPPTAGFIAKWLTTRAAITAGQWGWVPFIVGGGLLTAGYMFMILRTAFLPATGKTDWHAVPRSMEWIALSLAVLSLLLGLQAGDILKLLMVGAPFGGSL